MIFRGAGLQFFFQEEERAAFGYAGELAEHTIAKPFVKRPRLKAGGLEIREQIPVIGGVVLNRSQQRGAVPFSAVVFGDPHSRDVHRRAPKVSLRAADYAAILISQKARNRSRRLVPDDGSVEAADSIDDLPQLVRRQMLVQLKGDGSQRPGTPSSWLSSAACGFATKQSEAGKCGPPQKPRPGLFALAQAFTP